MASGIVRRAMVYLGLTDDDEFEYDAYEEPQAAAAAATVPPSRRAYAEAAESPTPAGAVSVRPMARESAAPSGSSASGGSGSAGSASAAGGAAGSGAAGSGSVGSGGGGGVAVTPRPVVRPIPTPPPPKAPPAAQPRVQVVTPSHFSDAQEIGDHFKNAQPVVVDLTSGDRELSRRMIDFCSGITYGLGGAMERVADQVFLLTPSNVELSADEKRRLAEKGLYRA